MEQSEAACYFIARFPEFSCSRSRVSSVRRAAPRLVLRQTFLDPDRANPRCLDGLPLWRTASSVSFLPTDGQFAWQIPRHPSRPSGSPQARLIPRQTATRSPLVSPIISSFFPNAGGGPPRPIVALRLVTPPPLGTALRSEKSPPCELGKAREVRLGTLISPAIVSSFVH